MEQAMKFVRARSTLSQSIRLLQRTAEELPVKVTNVLSAIDEAEYLITHNASRVVKQERDVYMQSLVGYFRQYTDWVKNSNTFWFGLGGCCVFLVPSIILSVKLAKYYRRMDTEDVFEEGQENW
ncbi:prominin-1-A-like isoform X3 [Oncorhynchus keta]|uniref:prominin-1-A-like isoform X3 n=1 Tax=Oncorhynchus keta TaxID=8018 RepID=UPI00227D1445|nr:prominin-1-A-like isoform X3 [Oncorhynchus keta]